MTQFKDRVCSTFLGGFHHSVLSYDIILQRGQKFMSTRTWLGREVDLWNDLTLVYRASCLSYFIIRESAIINFASETTCDSIDLTLWLVERTRANIATHTEAKVRPVKLWLILDLPAIATSQDLMDCMELQGSGCHRPNFFSFSLISWFIICTCESWRSLSNWLNSMLRKTAQSLIES